MLFLRILGIVMLVLSWIPVFNPEVKVFYKRSRVPLSRRSIYVSALAATAWCLGVFGVSSWICAGLFAGSVLAGMLLAKQDRAQYEKQTGRFPSVPNDPQQVWGAFFAIDTVFLSVFLSCLIRDHFWPPVTEEQKSVHFMTWGFFALTSMAAVLLYWKRPGKNAPEHEHDHPA